MRIFDDSGIMESTVSSRPVYDGMIVHVQELTNRLPNGKLALREVVRHVGAAGVIPVDANGNVYFVRQYRSPLDRVLLEIPAGKLDSKGEDRFVAAQRELREETGLTAAKWTHLNDILTTVGFCDECIGLYMAQDLSSGECDPDEDEFLNVVKVPLNEAYQMVMNNEINDTKTVIAILMAKQLLEK